MDQVIAFLTAFTGAEYRARCANYIEPDDKKFIKLVWEWDAMFTGKYLRSGLSRPDSDPSLYASADYVAAAAKQQPRSIFAVARYQHGRTDLYRAWLGNTELGRRGEGMYQNLYVAHQQDQLKIVSVYPVCYGCHGTGNCTNHCFYGWDRDHARGTKWRSLGRRLEVQKLQAPSDPLFQPAYHLIEEQL